MRQTPESQSVKLKDLKSMAIAIVAVLAMPVTVWMTREGPLQANSAPELAALAQERTQEEVIDGLRGRVYPYETTPKQVEQRWQEFKDELNESGIAADVVEGVVETARERLKGENWPVLARQGWIRDEPAWVIVSGWQPKESDTMYVCPPSPGELMRERHKRVASLTRVLVIESKAPYRLLSG